MEKFNLIKWLNARIEEETDNEIWANSIGNYKAASIYGGRRSAFSLVKTVVEGIEQ